MAYGLLGGVVMALIVFVVVLDSRPDLSVWHLADLDEEFTRDSEVDSFEQYLALEDRLFRQLDALVYDEVSRGPGNSINRYSRGSRADPDRWPVNWNRTFQLAHEAPRAVVL
ncbi:MAG: alpha/beta hydrolase, partial [Akkermansiaceae bacterium]|nr:alpha/beta hydrolase [Akkermansiaceae bacterium]